MDLLKQMVIFHWQEEDIEMLAILNYIRNDLNEWWSHVVVLFETQQHIRSRFSEEWLNRYIDFDFFLLFRMTRETFRNLMNVVMSQEFSSHFLGEQNTVTPENSMLMTLWWLGKGEVLNSVSDKFDVVVSTVFHYTEIILERLCELQNQYIRWPTVDEIETIEEQFYSICSFPGVLGAIDGCNIKLKAPTNQQESYIDKNGNHSIKLQAVVTANKILININVGFGGSVHDARVFRNSSLYVDIEENRNIRKYFPNRNYHILGDKAYPLLPWLMTPYKDYGNLERREKTYNLKHSKTRIKVEHCFGTIKPRFRILYYINVNNPIKAVKIITACCVLHNFCYLNADEWPGNYPDEENELNPDYPLYQARPDNFAVRKRDNITRIFENVF